MLSFNILAVSQYNPNNLLESSNADSRTQWAANIDYVAALYGPAGKFRFDGRLQMDEYAWVAKQDWATDFKGSPASLRYNAMKRFFLETPAHKICNQPEHANYQEVKEYKSTRYGSAVSVGGAHGCVEHYLDVFFAQEALMAVMALEKGPVIIFSEGVGDDHYPESRWLNQFSARMGIPQVMHVLPPEDSNIISKFRERGKLKELAAFVALATYLSIPKKNRSTAQLRVIFDANIQKAERQFGLLEGSLKDLVYESLNDRSKHSAYEKAYVDFSNELVRDIAIPHLRKNSLALYVQGFNHRDAVSKIYFMP